MPSPKLHALNKEEFFRIAQVHLRAMHAYHRELAGALAVANEEGEHGRSLERARIWGAEGSATGAEGAAAAADSDVNMAGAQVVPVAVPTKSSPPKKSSWLSRAKK